MPNIAPDNLPDKKIERLEQALESQRSRLARSQQENERLLDAILFYKRAQMALTLSDIGDEHAEEQAQVAHEGLLAALEEQEVQDE